MGLTPNGPVILFRFDVPQSASAAQAVFEPVKKEARQTTAQIADDWKRMSAQIRAAMATESMSTREIAAARRSIVDVLSREISLHRTKAELSNKELSNLKAMTLELERQKSHLLGTGGLTAGTLYAANQFSTQTYLGVTRALDALVNRYFGGTAGSLFRTVRDLGYYGSIGAGGVAGEGGGGLFSKLTSPAGLATLGGVGALTAAGVAIGVMADKGAKLTMELTDMSQKMGLTAENTIRLRTAASVLGVDMGSLAVGFKTFSKEIVAANAGNKQAVAIFKALGIDIKKAALDPYSAIQQLAVVFAKMPEGALKVATATRLFGRGGQQLLPILSELATVQDLTKKSSQDLAQALGGDVYNSTIKLRAQLANWTNETNALEVSLAQKLLPALNHVVGIINTLITPSPTVQSGVAGYLQSHRMQLTAEGKRQLDLVLGPTGAAGRTIDQNFALANPEWMIRQLQRYSGESASQLFEPFKDAGTAAKKAAGDFTTLQNALGGAGRAARDMQAEFWKSVSEELYRTGAASGHPFYPKTADQVLQRVFGPRPSGAPYLGAGVGASGGNVLAGLGLAPISTNAGASQTDILQVILGGDYNKIFDTRQQEYNRELVQLKQALDAKLISYQQYNTAVESINDDLHKEMMRQNEEFNRQADRLFDQLISGDRNFGRTLVNDLRDAMLAPIRNMFDQAVGGLLGGFSRGVQGGFNGTLGGIFGGGRLSRFATVPFLGNIIPGLGGNSAPTGTKDNPVYVADANALSGTGLSVGANGLIGGLLPLIGPGGSLIPSGGSGGSGGGLFGFLGKLFGGGGSGGGGFSLANFLGSGGPSGGFSLGKLFGGGGAGNIFGTIGGGLLMGLGSSTGGALGGLEGAAGGALSGALTGLTFGGPIGAAIGGIIGGIGGLISGIIGPSFQERVRKAMTKQQYYLPPSETFSFASNGSIASTLSTGFSQSGGRFSQFNLPRGTPFYASPIQGPLSYGQWLALQNEQNTLYSNQPFLGFPGTNPYVGQGPVGSHAAPVNFHITAIDAKGVAEFFQQHGEAINAIVTARSVGSSASRWGRSVRQSAFPP